MAQTIERQQVDITITVDTELLQIVDAFIDAYPDMDRHKVFDEALRLWYANEQEMEEQFSERLTAEDRAERAAWRRIRDAAAARTFGPR